MTASQAYARLTVVTRVWDAYVEFLPAFVEPLRAAAASGLRVIVVDNASRAPLPPLPAGVEVVRAPRRLGPGAAANLGLAAVRTEYVCFADADDVPIPEAWPELVRSLDADRAAVAACGRPVLWEPRRGRLVDYPIVARDAPALSARQLARALVLRNMFPVAGAVVRTDVARAVGGYGEIPPPLDDWPFSLALAWRGRVLFSPRPSFYYRLHEDSELGGTPWRAVVAGRRAAYRELRRRLRREPNVPAWLRLATFPLALLQWRRALARRKHVRGPLAAPSLEDPRLPLPS